MIDVELHHRRGDFVLDVAFHGKRHVALFGDSGAGKTTVLDAIAGLLIPDAGRIHVDGIAWLDRDAAIALPPQARSVGYVFQDCRLFPHFDVRGNLLYGPRSRNRAPARFDDIIDLLGLGALLARRIDALSGGERQRVAIGRALLAQPALLLLDEPLTGLHADARDDVLGYLRRLRDFDAVSMLLVSHHVDDVAALADEVAVLADGRVSRCCTITEFTASADTGAALYQR